MKDGLDKGRGNGKQKGRREGAALLLPSLGGQRRALSRPMI
jgi:hypothetical protein